MEEKLNFQTVQNQAIQICPTCHITTPTTYYFCPNCGKQIHEKPLSISIGKQLSIYLISIFLPPLGLWPAVKYLRQKSDKAKIIGCVAIILTIISIGVTLYYFNLLMGQTSKIMNADLDKLQGF